MNPTIRVNVALLLLLATGCERPGPATDEKTDVPLTTLEAAVPMAGAYREADITPAIRAAAEFAVREQSQKSETPLRLVKIIRAEQQMVAGTNHRLQLSGEHGGRIREVSAVVYQDPDSELELRSWDEAR